MSVHEINRPVPLGAITTLRVVTLFERIFDAITSWRSMRATEQALSDLSDAQLADIGLHRGDIQQVAEKLARA